MTMDMEDDNDQDQEMKGAQQGPDLLDSPSSRRRSRKRDGREEDNEETTTTTTTTTAKKKMRNAAKEETAASQPTMPLTMAVPSTATTQTTTTTTLQSQSPQQAYVRTVTDETPPPPPTADLVAVTAQSTNHETTIPLSSSATTSTASKTIRALQETTTVSQVVVPSSLTTTSSSSLASSKETTTAVQEEAINDGHNDDDNDNNDTLSTVRVTSRRVAAAATTTRTSPLPMFGSMFGGKLLRRLLSVCCLPMFLMTIEVVSCHVMHGMSETARLFRCSSTTMYDTQYPFIILPKGAGTAATTTTNNVASSSSSSLLSTPTTTTTPSYSTTTTMRTDLTLRDFLTDDRGFSLAMAPAFFGFYGYFGALWAWQDFSDDTTNNNDDDNSIGHGKGKRRKRILSPTQPHLGNIKHVAGASAGAMAAILLAAGVSPRRASEFCLHVKLQDFADIPGRGALFQGHGFERVMEEFLQKEANIFTTTTTVTSGGDDNDDSDDENKSNNDTITKELLLENAILPVAVTGYDLQSWSGKTLTRGSMAKAARASATFPFLFQPVPWSLQQTVVDSTKQDDDDNTKEEDEDDKNKKNDVTQGDYTLIDGGLDDAAGLKGLFALPLAYQTRSTCGRRIVNLKINEFCDDPPLGPEALPPCMCRPLGLDHLPEQPCTDQVLSLSIRGLPTCGPWNMHTDAPRAAVYAARAAMRAALEAPAPLWYRSRTTPSSTHTKNDAYVYHYELHIDASSFVMSALEEAREG